MGSQRDRSFQEEKRLVVSHSAEKESGGRAGECPLDFVMRFSKIGKGCLIGGKAGSRLQGDCCQACGVDVFMVKGRLQVQNENRMAKGKVRLRTA